MMILTSLLNFLKKYWLQVLLLIVIAIMVGSIKSCNDKVQEIKELKAHPGDSLANSKIKEWQDKYNLLHIQTENIQSQYAFGKYKDSIGGLLNIKPRQIQAASKTGSILAVNEKLRVDTAVVTNLLANGGSDTIKNYNFSWRDAWMQVAGQIGDKDSIHITGTDTLSRVDYWKRKWFLGAKHYYTDLNNSNPHIKAVGYKGIEFRQKEKKWSVGLSLQYGYPLNNIQFTKPVTSIGISLQYSIFKF